MATNIPDFTRYLRKPKGIYWQAFFLPVIKLVVAMFGIICTSSAKIVYGEYIWDPLTLAAQWDGPTGRCGAFFVGFAWVVAQIGTNLSANVISASNDLVNLFPKYVSIRRGVIVITVTAGWIMVSQSDGKTSHAFTLNWLTLLLRYLGRLSTPHRAL